VVEAQGYHWRALRDLADLEARIGDADRAEGLRTEADAVRSGVLDAFRADGCVVAMARDGQGRRLEVTSSNAGHLLWVGMLDTVSAEALADRLTAADMDGGWGLRTLSSTAVGYDPLSYHRGSIWPHDTALVADGITRAGRRRRAANLIDGVLRLAEHAGWRLPEVVAGYGVDEVDAPVPYPTTCSPQAWSAAVPLALLRTLLRLDPDVPAGRVALGPALRDDVTLSVAGIRLGAHRLDVSLDRGRISARTDATLGITVRDEPDVSLDAR
jgi:glycogen debranching enzyme